MGVGIIGKDKSFLIRYTPLIFWCFCEGAGGFFQKIRVVGRGYS